MLSIARIIEDYTIEIVSKYQKKSVCPPTQPQPATTYQHQSRVRLPVLQILTIILY
jgi:hypothetical protein